MSTTTAQELKIYIDESKTGRENPLLDADGKPLECLKLTAGDVQQLAVFFAGTPILEGGELPLLTLPQGSELQIMLKATKQSGDALTAADSAIFDQTRTCYMALLPLNTQQVKDLFTNGRRTLTVCLALSIVDDFTHKSFYVPAEITNAEFVPADVMAGNYALQAAQSAKEASASAEEAKESAEQSATSANEAKESKENAEQSATSAQGAQRAAEQAKEAAETSATKAGNSQNGAEAAKTTAQEQAQHAAQSAQEAQAAKEAAERAKTAAETAQTEAQRASQSAWQSAQQANETLNSAVETIGNELEKSKAELESAKDAAIEECEQTLANVYTKDQVYTKQETDTALEAEAQARQEAIEALNERVAANSEAITANESAIASQNISIPANYLFARGYNFAGEPLYEITAATASMPSSYTAPTNLNGAFAYCKNLRKVILGGQYPILKSPFSRDDIFLGCNSLEEICCPMVDSSGNPLYKARNHVGDWTGEYTTEQLINPKTGELEQQALDNGLRYARKESANKFPLLRYYGGTNLGDFFCSARMMFHSAKFEKNEVFIGDCIGYEVGYNDSWFLAYTGNGDCIKHVGDFIKVASVGPYMFYEAGKYTVGDFLAATKFYSSDASSHGFAAHRAECLGVGVFPKLTNGYAHFNGSKIPVMNIARLLRSLPIWDDDQEHTLTLTRFADKLDEQVSFRQCYKDGNPVDEVTVVSTTLRAEIEDCVNRKGWTISY